MHLLRGLLMLLANDISTPHSVLGQADLELKMFMQAFSWISAIRKAP